MNHAVLLASEGVTRSTFEWGRIQSNTDWIAPIVATIAILLFVRAVYRRDAVELRPALGWLLTSLRIAAFLGLLILYLQPHWRSEREEVRNSRVLLLVDTSMSMGQADAETTPANGAASRSQQVAAALKNTDFLARLRKTHDVAVLEFSEDLRRDRAVTLEKYPPAHDRDGDRKETAASAPEWDSLLSPTGAETRLGQSLRQLIQDERIAPVSGIVVFSDGGQNAGPSPEAAVALAQEAKIPIFTVGLGAARQPANVAVSDLIAPARAYPGDRYTVTGYLQAQGMVGQTVVVQVLSRPADDVAGAKRREAGETLATQRVTLGGDGEVLPVKFELTPDAPGRRTLCLRVEATAGDRNPSDNAREADIEIVDRKNRVLLVAAGPMRDYQFLRNQLYRDRYTAVDVLLQSGRPGISQEARKILDEFPTTREAMYAYDCVVAFDPNWQTLSAAQVELLEKWVSEQGGGLIVVAGPVNTCRGASGWIHNPGMAAIRNLYPVEFLGRLAATESGMFTGREPWPLDFTRAGLDADFLWPADSAASARHVWREFPGVYSCCPVRGPKPGATVYATFSNPDTVQDGHRPVYFAGQFYGAGNVFYMGSGELWRLRAIQESYFEQLYTKLIRHVSQGRLLRGSSRGVLLVGQDRYQVGNTVEVRARLTNARLEPFTAQTVNLQVLSPNGSVQTVILRADPARAGAFVGHFPAVLEGTYRLELAVPESENERLSRRIQVKIPDLERENPQRNDALLSAIAKGAGGRYYIGMDAAVATGGRFPLADQLKDRTSVVVLPIAPNPLREEFWLRWLMVGICELLCLEWLARRLLRLA